MPLSLLRYVNVPFSHHDVEPVQELVRTGLVVGGTSCSFRLWADAAVMKPQQAFFAARLWIPDVTHQPGESVAVTAEGPEASGGPQIPSSAINGHLFWIRAAGAVGALPKEEGVRSTWDKLPIHHTGCAHTLTPKANSASAVAAMGLREGSYRRWTTCLLLTRSWDFLKCHLLIRDVSLDLEPSSAR